MSNRYKLTINGSDHEVTLIEKNATNLTFELEGQIHQVAVTPLISTQPQQGSPSQPQLSRSGASHHSQTQNAPGEVRAPMPGVVISINVSVGDQVSAGDILLSLEAMKMENNITAPAAGTIESIEVEAQQEVENNQLLLKMK